jgi:hypothetical protein
MGSCVDVANFFAPGKRYELRGLEISVVAAAQLTVFVVPPSNQVTLTRDGERKVLTRGEMHDFRSARGERMKRESEFYDGVLQLMFNAKAM